MKASQYAKQNSISKMTVYRMIKAGKLPHKRLPTGTIVVLEEKETRPEYTVVYSRVSSSQNKNNLETQAERVTSFCAAKGWIVSEIIKECGSGLNDTRPKLQKVLANPKVTRIVVEHKDRLTRFGFAYIETLFNGELVVINQVENDRDDLMQDFVSLATETIGIKKLIQGLKND